MRKRVQQQPAFVLHTRAFSESSLIADVMTQHYGRQAMMVKGAKRLKSPLRGVLQPFQPLRISFSGKGELQTLTAAEFDGRLRPLIGKRLYCGFYLNELVLGLTHRHDPVEEVFSHYAAAVTQLANERNDLEATLRLFEVNLLASLGYGLVLDHEADDTATAIGNDQIYDYVPDRGPVPRLLATPTEPVLETPNAMRAVTQYRDLDETLVSVHGATLNALKAGDLSAKRVRQESKRLLRGELFRRLDGRQLRTRQLLHALSKLQQSRATPGSRMAMSTPSLIKTCC